MNVSDDKIVSNSRLIGPSQISEKSLRILKT